MWGSPRYVRRGTSALAAQNAASAPAHTRETSTAAGHASDPLSGKITARSPQATVAAKALLASTRRQVSQAATSTRALIAKSPCTAVVIALVRPKANLDAMVT
jgi:hypothetical protein